MSSPSSIIAEKLKAKKLVEDVNSHQPRERLAAPASTDALKRIHQRIRNSEKGRKFSLLDPTTSRQAAESIRRGGSCSCPRECGPMIKVGLHGSRSAMFCPKCRITLSLDEIHLD